VFIYEQFWFSVSMCITTAGVRPLCEVRQTTCEERDGEKGERDERRVFINVANMPLAGGHMSQIKVA